MRKSICVGILREAKKSERRAPLIPRDVNWLVKRGIKVEIQSNRQRIFLDSAYRKSGAKVIPDFKKADFLLGIKSPPLSLVHAHKIYMFFSHTIKGQQQSMSLLGSMIKKNNTLIDYEKIVDAQGRRLVYFGRFAGICGFVDSLYYLGQKLKRKGINNPFCLLLPAQRYKCLADLKQAMSKVARSIKTKGFDSRISPFIIGITGHGNVSGGVEEMLDILNPLEIHPRDMMEFVENQKGKTRKIYKIVFSREEKIRAKSGKGFYLEQYLKQPQKFESNLDVYLPYLNILIHGSYWDERFPRMITKTMVHRLAKRKIFRLEFIGDISCDINGSIELTHKVTSQEEPTFTYDAKTGKASDGLKAGGISILAIDNLPSELPKDASREFSRRIREYVYQIAAHGAKDIMGHAALPAEIRRAVITQSGKLTRDFSYLREFIGN